MGDTRRAGVPRRATRAATWLVALWLALLAPVALAQVAVPTLTAHVTDLTGTLSAEEIARLEARLVALEQRKGSQFLVLMLPTTQPEAIEEFALKVAEKNRIGRAEVDDGLLLLVAKDDRKARIEVGYGLEGVVTDALASRVIREFLAPKFRANDYAGGLDEASAMLEKLVDGEPLPPPMAANDPGGGGSFGTAMVIGVFVGFFVAALGLKPAPLRMLGAGGVAAVIAAVVIGGALVFVAAIAAAMVSLVIGSRGGGRYIGHGGGGGWGGGGGGWSSGGSGGGGWSGGGGGFGGGGASGGW